MHEMLKIAFEREFSVNVNSLTHHVLHKKRIESATGTDTISSSPGRPDIFRASGKFDLLDRIINKWTF